MIKTDSIIRTKLHLPFLRLKLVSRPRLKEQIAQGLRGPLTLLTAPAGFGKTTLVASCIASCGMPVAWLSLDKNDNQLERFLDYLVAALQEANHAIGSEAAQLLVAANQAPTDSVLTSLINDVANAGKEIALVLDDYQFVSNTAVLEAVTFLLEHCPKTLHLVVASRSDPLIPVARMRAHGQLVELRADDLRFSEAEATQFLNDVMGLNLDAGSIAVLDERTEGWIAGLQMAALSMRDRKDVSRFIEGFSGTNRYILDYLLEEILTGQPPEIQDFLLYTSILDRLAAPLCDTLLAIPNRGEEAPSYEEPLSIPNSASTLDYLERSNLFLLPLDDERTWYRYHHLFSDMLRARLLQSQPDFIPRLHNQAAAWLKQNGFIPEAIHHLFAAREIGRAADLIEHYGPAHLAESDPSVLQMADSLPQERILARPKIGLYLAWILIVQGRIGKARRLLEDMARELSRAGPDPEQQWMQTINSLALAFLAPPASNPEYDPLPDYLLLEEIPTEEPILSNAADFLYVMTLGRRGAWDHAAEVASRVIQREKGLQRTQAIPTLAPFLTRITLMLGRLGATASLCREFLDPIQGRDLRFIQTAGSMKIDLGEVLYEWNYQEEAEQHIREGLRANEPWQNIMTDSFGLVALTRVLQAKGDFAGAMQAVEKLESRLQKHSRPREFDEDFHTLRIRTQLAGGDLQNASLWADQIQLNEDFNRNKEKYRLTLARIRLAQGRYAEVEEMLAGTRPSTAAGSQVTRELESNLLLAAALARQRRLTEAIEITESTLSTAEPEGYVRVFLDVGEPVRDLLAAYLRSDAPGHALFAQKIMGAFSTASQTTSPNPQTAVLVEPLTEREKEVLELIALGRTNKEIAQQLFVAPGTVKAHTASIYRKLDVANRTAAAARARQLGILS